eukprot:12404862-Karenia_brevis.AAC.1
MKHVSELDMEELGGAWDDVHGGQNPLEVVRESRREEVDFIQGKLVWKLRTIDECWAATGEAPIKM